MPNLNTSEVIALLDRARSLVDGDELDKMLIFVGKRVGVKAEEIAGGYPPSNNGRPLSLYYMRQGKFGAYKSKFKSDKQQGYFFAALAKGTIVVPRTRTGRLGASITSESQVIDNGVVVKVGTKMPYAPYVIGDDETRSHYHTETGWLSLEGQLNAHEQELITEVSNTLNPYIRGFLAGA